MLLRMSSYTMLSLVSASVAGCLGCGGGESAPDAAPVNTGFNPPAAALRANVELGSNNWMDVGPADLSCLNTPTADKASTIAGMLTTVVQDFQLKTPVFNAAVTAFGGIELNSPFAMGASAGDGKVSIAIPAGTKRFGFKITSEDGLPTLLLNQILKEDGAVLTKPAVIKVVSMSTGNALLATIGVTRSPDKGVLAGALRDCQGREMSNFIATVSTTSKVATRIEGAPTYYFSPTSGVPARLNKVASGSGNGLFLVIEIPPVPSAFVQMWGYPTDADLAAGSLKLISELTVPVLSGQVITGSYEPLRQ
jgi:hypothetical protein